MNAFSFLAMFIALRTMNPRELHTPKPVGAGAGELRSALRYVRGTPELLIPLAMMALVGTISFNFQVLLPLLADFTWNGTATTYAMLTAAMGVGSVAGALAAGARGRVSPGLLVVSSLAFGLSMLLAAAAPTLELQLARADPAGRGARDLRRGRELGAADPRRADHARARDGAVLDRLPRLDPDRRAAGGLAGRGGGPRAGLVAGAVAALLAGVAAWFAFARRSEAPVVARPHGGRVRGPKRLATARDRVPSAARRWPRRTCARRPARRGTLSARAPGRHTVAARGYVAGVRP